MRPTLPLLALALLGAPRAAAAQEVFDRAVFVIAHGGAETGRAEFAIIEAAGRDGKRGLLVTAKTRTPAHEVEYALELTDLLPTTFQQTETTGGRIVRHVSATIVGIRFSARASSPEAEVARELPVRRPFVIMGDEDFTAFYFLPRPDSGATRTVTVIRTRDLLAVPGSVIGLGDDTLTVAGRMLRVKRYSLHVPGSDTREFWVTPGGSLVQVSFLTAGIIARRSDAPDR